MFLHTIWRPKVIRAKNIPASGGAILAVNETVVDWAFLPPTSTPGYVSVKAEIFTRPVRGPAVAATCGLDDELRMERDGPGAAEDALEGGARPARAGPAVRYLIPRATVC